ncbi:hypothetical protein BU23DRAFT_595172 [Bimuria novae-zelandiae CBS 107.79]|uniref:DNA endonuclease activator Ctp1 C-terminal domain-containing protein n=1 Tax=Bimuria novae-zelandiae CBS 107.79 TaxID=1447943 RepID=A0A6A5VU45_9PLEO|nr:hypothetical protein BU23DRAFT_595172 [Bimuria novae-zelandiae CBS 107.79]
MADFGAWLANNKALWARVYDEVIAPDLEKEWKKRIEAHDTGLKIKDEEFRILEDHVSKGVVKNARLTEENARLKNLLQKHGIALPKEDFASTTDEAPVLAREFHEVIEQLHDLNKRHQDAAQRIKYLERKNVTVMQKNKDMKESVKAWQEYSERHLEKKKLKTEGRTPKVHPKSNLAIEMPGPIPNIPSSPASAAILGTPRSLLPQERSSPAPMAELPDLHARPHTPGTAGLGDAIYRHAHIEGDGGPVHQDHEGAREHVESNQRSSPPLPTGGGHAEATSSSNNDRAAFLGHFSSDKITSSQTTVPEVIEQDHEATPRATNQMEDDDEPVVVSERSLKRKRKPSQGLRIFHDGSSDGTPAKPVRVKEEQYSSPPPESAINQLSRKETMDLDELGPNPIVTPRRRRLRRGNSIYSNKIGTLRHQRSSSAPFSGKIIKPEPTEEVHMPGAGTTISHLAIGTEDTRAISEPMGVVLGPRGILQSLNPNVVANRANEETPNKHIKKDQAREETEFMILAESGEMPPPTDERKKRLPPNVARAHFNERIRAAKSGLSPIKNALATPKTAPAKVSTAQMPTPPPTTNRPAYTPSARPAQRRAPAADSRQEVIPDGRPVWRMGGLEPSRKAPAPPQTKERVPEGRLRNKPVSELRIQDFKANPAYNGGYTHAFTETVRRREDRLCLPGCTNPTCCGSTFRTLALAALPLSSSQEEVLLQDYLGDAYDSFGLTQMDKDERDEIVLQARTRKMATEHGKHRRTYEGRKTPPGFWRVDFPSTQEQEEDREKATQMEQLEVRNRWLEAMRKGGKS